MTDLRLFQTLWIFPYIIILLTFRKEMTKRNQDGFPIKPNNIIIVEYATISVLVTLGCLLAIIGGLNYFSLVNLWITEHWESEFEYLMLILLLISFFEYAFFSLNKYLIRSS
ncbi:hypothetical protein ACNF40_05205 [Cuniculiplasma sp. SKW4]|uniref:hypothetical protein n=1 Tax=Cuniculiplasma sp. SKW4 TaxID=3400171 RepID=UPI003FCF9680